MDRYAELHCHSGFSFLDGASDPEELVAEAARLGLEALALTDHGGLYGAVRFAEAARAAGMPTVFGAEVTLGIPSPRTGVPDPAGEHLVLLARDPAGYAELSVLLAEAHLRGGEKGRAVLALDHLAQAARGRWWVLTGCRKGPLATALRDEGPRAARRRLDELREAVGSEAVAIEVWDHGDPLDTARNDALALLAAATGLPLVATNNVHYATAADFPRFTALAATRARRSLADLEGWLPGAPAACLRGPSEQARRMRRWPGALEAAVALAADCAFDLRLVAPKLPDFPCPGGVSEMEHLRALVEAGATARYGSRSAERVAGAWDQIDHELGVIDLLGFAGYFLIVHDITEFCRAEDIYCQGRGSAANSAACFALGITNADAVRLGLLFERFLSPARDGPPDIDVDIESARREEVIQYVYARYGRRHAAQVANVITYRPRSAIRDMARALGSTTDEADRWAGSVDRGWHPGDDRAGIATQSSSSDTGAGVTDEIPALVAEMAADVLHRPRHLGIHSAGMVLCDRPVIEVCPVEWGRTPGRSVLQWDKDDCAAIGLVKFDLLGLGMLGALHRMVDLVAAHEGIEIDLGELPQDDAVYDMLCRADTVGVFQVESRAQMGTLPRVEPRCFYDLVIEVALIRPGPIQGNAVNPYIRRRRGEEPITYPHPLLEPILHRTLGVPLFQEQLMEMAVAIAGFSATDADELRQAMAAKRSDLRMAAMRERLFAGMAERGIDPETADSLYRSLAAFANFGFPESHSVSFAHLVYCSAWMKHHHPAAFTVGLLASQPMGFWSPQSLLADAERHGVAVRRPDVQHSAATASLERDGVELVIRLGLDQVRGMGAEVASRIAAGAPWASQEDLVRRAGASRAQLEALAMAGALDDLGESRRSLLWGSGAAAQATPDRLPGVVTGLVAPELDEPSALETVADDLWAIGVTPDATALGLARPRLDEIGALRACDLPGAPLGRVLVAGAVTHRQRPESARGAVFINLEDETGHVNVVFSTGAWARWRSVARFSPALIVAGRLERAQGVTNVVVERVEALDLGAPTISSRDLR
jgi:error-prone DNA polymerase